jgi:phosphoribosylamine--glycine ligase
MNILVIGGGGREHALCWKLRQSSRVDRLFAAPGNAGIAHEAECVALDVADHGAVIAFCQFHRVALVVIGPEGPLVDGLADSLRAAGIRAFGPSAAAAQLEGSKGFTKDLCAKAGIPTAAYARFTDAADAREYVAAHALPVVIKADGLAAGKGVVIAATAAEANAALDAMAGGPVVIEECMTGPEASFFVLTDGITALPLASAQDHKRVGDGDTGPNTGGMGAYSPAAVLTPTLAARALEEIVKPTIKAMADAGTPFQGVLYAGLMLTPTGPRLIEYNARFGDPECQVLMMRLQSDLLDLLLATCDATLADAKPVWRDDAALVVVMAADGYPGVPVKGTPIEGIAAAEATGAVVFHAGTVRGADGVLRADGGRVLGVAALGATVTAAAANAYAAVDKIDWPGGFCRRDIGKAAIAAEQQNLGTQ